MKYKDIVKAKFIDRPNRFIANCEIDGDTHKVHVKNTGRCKELLTDNIEVYLEHINSENRKTNYDLISVYKGDVLFNMDSQIPNRVLEEALLNKKVILDELGEDITLKSEVKYKNSRFDFFIHNENKKAYIEVKGVTLEEDGVALFPDAPTIRGIKHINELVEAKREGYISYIVFIIQFKGVKYFTPNPVHKDFIDALKNARKEGVNILAYDCKVTENEIILDEKVKVEL